MKYVIDTEFIDTPTCSALISIAIVREDGAYLYSEFQYADSDLTQWLMENVVPHLVGSSALDTHAHFAKRVREFVGSDRPEFWAYCGAYDWYWFCRLWGGFTNMPQEWPMLYREFALIQTDVPDVAGACHNALNDARSLLHAMRLRGMLEKVT